MSVTLLPKEIRSKIRSGIAINTLVDCVEALVQNAIDAQATCVAVRIDLPFYKIQVVDNGHGINKHDFQLIGEWYATSKYHNLPDVGNPKYYGFRGEALASLREISEEITVVSRVECEDTTYSKSFRGPVNRIDVSAIRRPSCGTTVTIFGFLHNLPVRQAALIGPMEIERVRRSLESLAIINPCVSFSLRDDSNNAWCFRVPKTDSVITTFAHIFGSCWATALKPVSGSALPFHLSGFLSLRGHRNKNLQFIFVHRQRILGHRLEMIINQIHASFLGCSASPPTNSGTVDKHPVFVLKIECPLECYDIGFHPSKTIVEFQKFEIIVELVKSVVSTFLEKTCKNVSSVPSSEETPELQPQENSSVIINPQNYKNSLHSLAAKRVYKPADPDPTSPPSEPVSDGFKTPKNVCGPFGAPEIKQRPLVSIAEIRPFDRGDFECPIQLSPELDNQRNQAFSVLAKTPLQPTSKVHVTTLRNVHDTSKLHPKKKSKLLNSLPKHFNASSSMETFTGDSPCPIHLSPALDHKRSSLVNFIDVKERRERICLAITELKRFSHRSQQSEMGMEQTTPTNDYVGRFQKDTPSTGSNSVHTRTIAALPIASVAGNRRRVPRNEHFRAKKMTFQSSEGFLQYDCRYFPNSLLRDMPLPISAEVQILHTDKKLSPESINTPASLFPNPNHVPQQSLDDITPDVLVISSPMDYSTARDDIQNFQKTCSDKMHADVSQSPTVVSENQSQIESIVLDMNPLPSNLENDADKSTEQTWNNWLHGVDPSSKQNFYINTETGHSYFGQPPPSDSPSLKTTLISGHPLPLDTNTCDNRLATSALPFRPWRHTNDPDTSQSNEEKAGSSVKQMLQMWENPVFKCDLMSNSTLFAGKLSDINNEFFVRSHPYTLDKDIFGDIKVIAQVDQKFIICSCCCSVRSEDENKVEKANSRRLLVAFDQHAVHERIRLEKLIQEAENEDCSHRLKTSPLDPPVTVHLASSVARICLTHQQELKAKGIEISSCSDKDGDRTPVGISVVPKCLVDAGKGTDPELIENLLCELVETLEETRTFGTEIPKIVIDILKSQACHGAIKFGDMLCVVDCQNLITMLGKCKSPFFCAHGRPSIVPLFDYDCLQNVCTGKMKPKLWKLAKRLDVATV